MMPKESKVSDVLNSAGFEVTATVLGHLAHDFNNLLTPLLAYPALVKTELPEGAPARGLIDAMEKTARDMLHITRQLLDLTSRKTSEKTQVQVNAVVAQVTREVISSSGQSAAAVESALGEDTGSIPGVPEKISLAIRHLLKNAMEAAGSEGKVGLQTRRVKLDGMETALGEKVPAGEYVCVAVSDNGPGIPDSLREHLFMPFTTTKKAAGRHGAGLGLSIVYRVICEHGGAVDFQSGPQGTVFSAYFPVVSPSLEAPPSPVTRPAPVESPTNEPRNLKRLLVVDDEKSILKLFQMILRSSLPECQIDTASNGQEALAFFEKEHHGLLLMDLHMPVMDGKVAFTEIEKLCAARNWEMPSVVFCTGFAPSDSIRSLVAGNPRHVILAKPVKSDNLVEAVRSRIGA